MQVFFKEQHLIMIIVSVIVIAMIVTVMVVTVMVVVVRTLAGASTDETRAQDVGVGVALLIL